MRNRQRKIPVNVADLEIFAGKALRRCLQLQKRKATDLDKLHEVFVWLISDRRMAFYIGNFCIKRVRRTCSLFNTAKSLSASRQQDACPRIWELARARVASTSPMGFYICTGLTIGRQRRAENESMQKKILRDVWPGSDDPEAEQIIPNRFPDSRHSSYSV